MRVWLDKIPMAVTLKDIAERTGVSPSVVSTVLSGRENGTFVSEGTRRKVLQVAELLHYTPVRSGRPRGSRRLRRLHTEKFIGVWDPDYSSYSAYLVHNLQIALREYAMEQGAEAEDDFGLRLLTAEDLPRLDSLGLMGVLLLSSSLLPREAAGANIPAVMVGEVDHPPRELVQVHLDNEDAGRQLGEYLWGLGHRQIAFLAAGAASHVTRKRLLGLQSVWAAHGVNSALVKCHIYDTMKTLGERDQIRLTVPALFGAEIALSQYPTALVCPDENVAAVALQILAERGMRVPQHISLAAFGDTPRLAEALTPPLTVIRQPTAQIAKAAIQALYQIHDAAGAEISLVQDISLPGLLITRASCAPPAA
jgi:DNA-binding LacI/PurR family transcriptional regulator